jgi:hypothetical protein
MNTFEFYSNTNTDDVQDDVASAPLPVFPWAMEDYSCTFLPQSTHPDLIPTPGYLSTAGPYLPDFNATDYAALAPTPTTEMGMFTSLLTRQVDYAHPVSNQYVRTCQHLTYPAVPQNAPEPWMLAPHTFLSCICHDPLYSSRCDTKLSLM